MRLHGNKARHNYAKPNWHRFREDWRRDAFASGALKAATETQIQATLTVASNALDVDDCRTLLAMLGLDA